MASLVVLGVMTIVVGTCIGAFLALSFAIRRDDRERWALRFDAPNQSAQTARMFVGISRPRWDD